jgi:hypothetical protein
MSYASTAKTANSKSLYERDRYAWSRQQVRLLCGGRLAAIDRENIAEEILKVGRTEYEKLESALRILLLHMLKWDCQPERRSRSWEDSIAIQRRHALRQLEENPSLKSRRDEAVQQAYHDARELASSETNIDLEMFPEPCPCDWDAITMRGFTRG